MTGTSNAFAYQSKVAMTTILGCTIDLAEHQACRNIINHISLKSSATNGINLRIKDEQKSKIINWHAISKYLY